MTDLHLLLELERGSGAGLVKFWGGYAGQRDLVQAPVVDDYGSLTWQFAVVVVVPGAPVIRATVLPYVLRFHPAGVPPPLLKIPIVLMGATNENEVQESGRRHGMHAKPACESGEKRSTT